MGWLSGLLGAALKKLPVFQGKKSVISYGITGFVGSAMNTLFYLGGLWLLCSSTIAQYYGIDLSGVGGFVMSAAATLGTPEAILSCIVVAAVCKALEALEHRLSM